MRHWERLSLNDGESLVYWLRKLVFRGAYLDHRVKEDLLEVSFDEATGDFGYAEPEGGRALLELAPTPSWRALQFQAASQRRLGSPARREAERAARPRLRRSGSPGSRRPARSAPAGSPSSQCGQSVTNPNPGSAEIDARRCSDPSTSSTLTPGLLEPVLGAEALDRAARCRRDELVERAGRPGRPDQLEAPQNRLPSTRTAPTCLRPSSVITRPRGVRWRNPSWSRYGS